MSVDQDGINLSSDEWMDYRLPDLESEKGHEEIVVVEGEILPPGRIFSLRQLLELDETELENLCMIWNVESYFTREQKATSVSYKMLKALEEDNLRLLSSLEIDGDGMESEGGDDGNMSDGEYIPSPSFLKVANSILKFSLKLILALKKF